MHEQAAENSDESPSQTQASIERLAEFYESWNAAELGKGYEAKAAEWRAKLPAKEEFSPPNDSAVGGTQGTGNN